jgi:hypothetical protein
MAILLKYCSKYTAEIKTFESGPLMYTDPKNILLTSFTDIVAEVTGNQPSLDKEHGTTD